MSTRQRLFWFGGIALVVIWMITAGAMWFAKQQTPTAEKTVDLILDRSLTALPETDRPAYIEKVAASVNRLSFDERHKLRFDERMRPFYDDMTDTEKVRFLDLTLPTGMRQMMEAFNQMPPDRRKELVDQALAEVNRHLSGDRAHLRRTLDDRAVQRIIKEGFTSFFRDATAQTKLDLQPIIEQIQKNLQTAR